MTMRNLVINDIVDQLSLGLLKCLEQTDDAKKLAESNRKIDAKSDSQLKESLRKSVKKGLELKAVPTDDNGPLDMILSLEQYSRDHLAGTGLMFDKNGDPRFLAANEIVELSAGERMQFQANLEDVICAITSTETAQLRISCVV